MPVPDSLRRKLLIEHSNNNLSWYAYYSHLQCTVIEQT